jgi:DNA-binding response OmpR family regulator
MSHILLVEDNPQSAEMTIRILEAAGYTVKHCERGFEGAKQARLQRPGLILMDFNLPDVDGRTLILGLKRQLGGDKAPPFVALTARNNPTEMVLAQRFGYSAFISKPFSPERLLEVTRDLIPQKDTQA